MIKVINITKKPRIPIPEGSARTVLGPRDEGTRVQVAIEEISAGRTRRFDKSDQTRVVYVMERRAGVYLEPGEETSVTATDGPLTLLLVTVPKHTGKPVGSGTPAGYAFEEARLRSLVDEKGIRERTFWVNKETGLSGSWDMQLGRMLYAPGGYSPRHVHHPSKAGSVTPEHFYLIEKGIGEVKHDAGTLPVGPGSLVLIPAGEWHQLIASETGFDYIEFQAPFDFVTTMDHDPLGKNWYIKGTDDGTGKPKLWVQS
jgi:mannose-6-phosphate isomerase-like protein (cupin superfamily)